MRDVAATRDAAARLIGAEAADIAFVVAILGGDRKGRRRSSTWRDGDEVVLGDLEYPANFYPWACPAPARRARIASCRRRRAA
jgi:selenocysteine lyase/cysteine desulfurase